jgi:two-component system chemotaxis response regulator CheB
MRDEARFEIVAIGASAGGFDALCTLVGRLPPDFGIAVAIVQHRAKESEALAELLQGCTKLRVVEVEDKEPMQAGTVYVAPPDYHLLAEEGAFALSTEGLVAHSRPSIDVFFESVADVYGARAIGIVLTGASADGSKGLQRIEERGGQALVQDPSTAQVAMMPSSAQRVVERARIMTLEQIASHLTAHDRMNRRHSGSGIS